MDFSTAVTLESFFPKAGGRFDSILVGGYFAALWCAGAPRCILNASGDCSSCTYVQVIRVTCIVTFASFVSHSVTNGFKF